MILYIVLNDRQASNFSISSLLGHFEIPLKPPAASTVTVDEETRFSTDVSSTILRVKLLIFYSVAFEGTGL